LRKSAEPAEQSEECHAIAEIAVVALFRVHLVLNSHDEDGVQKESEQIRADVDFRCVLHTVL
jgi:hypothetical protein